MTHDVIVLGGEPSPASRRWDGVVISSVFDDDTNTWTLTTRAGGDLPRPSRGRLRVTLRARGSRTYRAAMSFRGLSIPRGGDPIRLSTRRPSASQWSAPMPPPGGSSAG